MPVIFQCAPEAVVATAEIDPEAAVATETESAEDNKLSKPVYDLQGLHNKCPFLHGTVRCDPYPGYVQGRDPSICKYGCVPATPGALEGETLEQRLMREALEFCHLYHAEKGTSHEVYEARKESITAEIAEMGRYEHTFDELQHGARVAWRNAGKCINRQVHMELNLSDCRQVTTNDQMFEAICSHLRQASAGAAVQAVISVFPGSVPTGATKSGTPTAVGPRVWNSQLVRFAGHRLPCGGICGDPAEVEFTTMLKAVFGWKPPTPLSQFDVLPLVVQASPNEPPQLFELPPDCARLVDITHPRVQGLESLCLKWYAIPAVSSIELSLGGMQYTASPFNGWYMTTEIATRNFGDAARYDLLPAVAQLLGLDVNTDSSMWKEHALAVLNEAVAYSFSTSGVSIANHHSLAASFATWYEEEKKTRGYCPANWKWIVPPAASSTTPLYLGGNKWTDYTLFPAYLYSPSWKKHLEQALSKSLLASRTWTPPTLAQVYLRAGPVSAIKVLICYAGMQGATKARAIEACAVLSRILDCQIVNLSACKAQGVETGLHQFANKVLSAQACLLLVSTCGSGDLPDGGEMLRAALHTKEDDSEGAHVLREAMGSTPIALYGRGNSSYARYNRGGDQLDAALRAGATPTVHELVPYTRGDEMADELGTFRGWLRAVVEALVSGQLIMPKEAVAALSQLAPSATKSKLRWRAVDVDKSLLKYARQPLAAPSFCIGVVKENIEALAAPTFAHSTRLLKIDFSRAARQSAMKMTYAPGDHVKVYPESPAHVVDLVASHLGVSLDGVFDLEPISEGTSLWRDMAFHLSPQDNAALVQHRVNGALKLEKHLPFAVPTTYRTALGEHLALLEPPPRELLLELADNAADEDDAPELRQVAANTHSFSQWLAHTGARVADLFELFPSLSAVKDGSGRRALVINALCSHAANTKPRYYSVASSAESSPHEFALVLSRVNYRAGNGVRHTGFASGYLTSLQSGMVLKFAFEPCRSFHLPTDASTPVLMIAAGTGASAFRGFLLARIEQARRLGCGALGSAALLFGCRDEGGELLRNEAAAALAEGGITEYHVAHSRKPGTPKKYVQHVVVEQPSLVQFLAGGAAGHVYVCGAANMAAAVQDAMASVMSQTDIVEALRREGRYHEDVFSAPLSTA